jgi:hypothetical protein
MAHFGGELSFKRGCRFCEFCTWRQNRVMTRRFACTASLIY